MPADPATPAATSVDWRTIGRFLALCFGLTWGVEIAALAAGLRFDQAGTAAPLVLGGAMLVPALSAWVVLRLSTGSGKQAAVWRFGPWRPWVLVWLGTPLVLGLVSVLGWALGLATLNTSADAMLAHLPPLPAGKQLPPVPVLLALLTFATLTYGLLLTTLFTFGEEYGWTGFLLPALLPLGKWRAVLVYGTVWGLWHAPAIVGGYNYPGHPVAGVAMMCLFTTAVGSVQCALLLRFRSVFLTSFLHGSINSGARGALALLFTVTQPLLGGVAGLTGCLVIGGIGLLAMATCRGPDALAAGA